MHVGMSSYHMNNIWKRYEGYLVRSQNYRETSIKGPAYNWDKPYKTAESGNPTSSGRAIKQWINKYRLERYVWE